MPMRKYWKPIVAFNLLLVLAIVGWQVWLKEKVIAEGKLVLLDLAPKDPRSLMQGDYMELRYAEVRDLSYSEIPARGYMVMKIDEHNVGKKLRVQETPEPIAEGEILIKYFYNERFVSIGAESYFFEEGQAKTFENARYGGLRINNRGESVLVGLYDENHQLLEVKRDSL